MSNIVIESIHSANELSRLKRKSAEAIRGTISEQDHRNGRKMKRREEYLTRALLKRGYLVTENEPVIYDQYPLWKRPNRPHGPEKIDVVYIYAANGIRYLGVVEAKVVGGESLDAVIKQLGRYVKRWESWREERVRVLQELTVKINDKEQGKVKLPDDFRELARFDILAPYSWWAAQKEKDYTKLAAFGVDANLEVRLLSVPDDYLSGAELKVTCLPIHKAVE